MIEFGNLYYFIFLLAGAGIFTLVWFLLKDRSDKTKKLVLFIWLMLNFSCTFSSSFCPDTPFRTPCTNPRRKISAP